MSRLGKKPIGVPAGVNVRLDGAGRTITVEGPKGSLEYAYRPEIDVAWDEDHRMIVCSVPEGREVERAYRAYWGTVRSRISSMVVGASAGFAKRLEIVGVGWNAQAQGKTLRLNVGYCHPVEMTPPDGVAFEVAGAFVTVSGSDKQKVGQFAAEIRSKRPPEPYNGKGIKYVGEIIIRKQGKVFGK